MVKMMTEIFAAFGATIAVIAMLSLVFAIGVLIRDFVKQKICQYKVAHMFDKKPTANCYCRDCRYWNNNGDRHCGLVDRFAEEWGFCWLAEPRRRDETGGAENE